MAKYRQFSSNALSLKEKHQLLLASVAPRPIGFTASKSSDGYINLAPFSYHNAFSSNPPVVGISPAFSGRTGQPKNTLTNILDSKEFTLSVVTFDMVEQMNICAAEYGTFKFLLPELSQMIFSPGPLIFKLRKGLKDYTTEDFLLLTGDPAIIGVACSIVADITNGKFNLLKWDKQERKYYPIHINLFEKGDLDESN